MADLSFVTMDELWMEIVKRTHHALLVTEEELTSKELGAQIFFHGGKVVGIGLAEFAKYRCLGELNGPPPEDDDGDGWKKGVKNG